MNYLDLSTRQIDGGFFLLNGRGDTPFTWSTANEPSEQFIGTYRNSGEPVKDTLLQLIRNAKRNIFLASFIIGDDDLIEELIAAADRLRGGVYLITALDEKSLRKGLQYDQEDDQTPPELYQKNFERLTSNGIYVRGHGSCHAKFAVVDGVNALAGSSNYVTNSFNYSGEANVLINDFKEVAQLKKLFTQLWYEGCSFTIPPGDAYKVEDYSPQKSPFKPSTPNGAPGEIVWSNGKNQLYLLNTIKEVVNSAEKQLTLASYSVVGMIENPNLIYNNILDAIERNVSVRLFVRQRNAWPDQLKQLETLYDAGVKIYADIPNHAKVVIADDNDAILFSANLDANHGLTNGVEIGYRFQSPNQIRALSGYIDHAINHANTSYVRRPTLCEIDGKLAARWCKKWNAIPEVKVNGDKNIFDSMASDASLSPCLFEESKDGRVIIWIGKWLIQGSLTNNSFKGEIDENEGSGSTEKMYEWVKSVRGTENTSIKSRGFFSGTLNYES